MPNKSFHITLTPYPRWYVYIHYDPRKVRPGGADQIDHVVYVGKGTRERAWVDTRPASPDHGRWLRDRQYEGFCPNEYVTIVKSKLTPESAAKFEKGLIALYRRKGVRLFNKEKGYTGPVLTYDNKFLPDPRFGKLARSHQTEGDETVVTDDEFKKTAVRTQDETNTTYDLRPFEDRQQEAVALYLGKLMFRLSAKLINPRSTGVVLLVDARFVTTPQLNGFVKKLNAAGLSIEVRRLPVAAAKA